MLALSDGLEDFSYPTELLDAFKSTKQAEDVDDKSYIHKMRDVYRQLAGVIRKKDAMLYTTQNLKDSKVQGRLEEKVKSGEITHFGELTRQAAKLNLNFVGRSDGTLESLKRASRPSAPRAKLGPLAT